jgi:hypothetical protein
MRKGVIMHERQCRVRECMLHLAGRPLAITVYPETYPQVMKDHRKEPQGWPKPNGEPFSWSYPGRSDEIASPSFQSFRLPTTSRDFEV